MRRSPVKPHSPSGRRRPNDQRYRTQETAATASVLLRGLPYLSTPQSISADRGITYSARLGAASEISACPICGPDSSWRGRLRDGPGVPDAGELYAGWPAVLPLPSAAIRASGDYGAAERRGGCDPYARLEEAGEVKPYYEEAGIQLFLGDCRDILPHLAPGSADMVLTDPRMEWDV